jgi:hypothetical protein
MDKQTESREQFEAEFRQCHSFVPEASMAMMLEQYNFGTDEEPDLGYYSLAARDAWEWWQKSRESLVVELPQKISEFNRMSHNGVVTLEAVNYDEAIDDCAESIRAIGIRIKGE